MKSYSKETGNVVVLTEYLDAGLSRKSYPGWIRIHFPKQYAENPKIASIKTRFECPGKDMLIAIQKTQAYNVSKEKRAVWLTAASKTLNTPIEIPLYSESNSKLAKELFHALNIAIDIKQNISGLSFPMRKHFRDLMESKIRTSCFNILNEIGLNLKEGYGYTIWMPLVEAQALFEKHNLNLYKSFENNNFASGGINPFITGSLIETWSVLFVLTNELWK